MIARLMKSLFGENGSPKWPVGVKARRSTRITLDQAALPDGHRAYVIGDIHGRADLLSELLDRIGRDTASAATQDHLIYLGDFVDRGHQSRDVIDIVLAAEFPGVERVALMGNHEDAMMAFLDDPMSGTDWLSFGGDATLLSYGVPMAAGVPTAARLKEAAQGLDEALPVPHRRFLAELEDWHVLGDYMFVHAGIDPNRSLKRQRPRDLRWIRQPFLGHTGLYEKIIVHGHNITDTPEFHSNRIGIDTGAYYSGCLTCLVLEGNERRVIQTGTS